MIHNTSPWASTPPQSSNHIFVCSLYQRARACEQAIAGDPRSLPIRPLAIHNPSPWATISPHVHFRPRSTSLWCMCPKTGPRCVACCRSTRRSPGCSHPESWRNRPRLQHHAPGSRGGEGGCLPGCSYPASWRNRPRLQHHVHPCEGT